MAHEAPIHLLHLAGAGLSDFVQLLALMRHNPEGGGGGGHCIVRCRTETQLLKETHCLPVYTLIFIIKVSCSGLLLLLQWYLAK